MERSRRDAEFREAFPRLHERAYQAAFRLLGDRVAAEDAAQEALTRAYVHWSRLDERREGWVVTTTFNIVLDGFRRQKRWEAFRTRYLAELDRNADATAELRALCRRGPVTLLYAARDTQHNQALVLAEYLARHR